MDTSGGNPFAVLTAVVAPAILTNACSVLALGTSNRLGRVVDRTRVVARELAGLEPGAIYCGCERNCWSGHCALFTLRWDCSHRRRW